MLRFTDAMLNNKELEEKIGFHEREEEFMREFFLDRVQEESVLSGQAFLYLHYADMIANGYQRTMPCPFQTQGLLLNPYGDLYYCENSKPIGNVLDHAGRGALLQGREPRPPRARQGHDLPDLPQPVPGERRRDEAVRAVREVPHARVPGEARSRPASDNAAQPTALKAACRRAFARIAVARTDRVHPLEESPARSPRGAGRHADWGPIAVAVLLVLVDRALMAYRWVVLLCTIDPARRRRWRA